MELYQFNWLVSYLNEKGVTFAVKEDHVNNTFSIIGVKITKTGKFFRANGKIVAKNMISEYFLD